MKTTRDEKRGFSRRAFLKWSGAGVGGAALATMLPFSLQGISKAEAAQFTRYTGGAWTSTCCNMCGGQCGLVAYVEDGVVRKVEPQGGTPGVVVSPNNVSNTSGNYTANVAAGDIGRLCCKGNSALKTLYDPDRLQTPLRRVGPRGSDQFEAITWDEAIEESARQLASIRATWGARSLVWFAEDHSFNHPQVEFCKAYGTPNFSNHSNLCDTSRKSHYLSTIGHDRPLADMENADLMFIWGWNFLSAIKWIHLAPIFTRARMNNPNFQMIYVDPVFNTTASKADRWVPVRPGTDGALALALCKYLIDNNGVDNAFVTAYTLGYDEFVRLLNAQASLQAGMDYTGVPWAAQGIIAWAAATTGISVNDINAIGAQLVAARAANRRICIDAWSGPGHHTNATQGGRAIDCLTMLLGAVDAQGTLVFPLRNGPPSRAYAWGNDYHFNYLDAGWVLNGWRADGRDDVTIPATYTYPDGSVDANPYSGAIRKKYSYSHGSGIYVEMRECMIDQQDFVGNPYPIKACVMVFQNFMMSVPNPNKSEQALNNMEFVLCVDTHLSETAMMADIVVPGSHYLERNDFNANWSLFRSVGLRQRVVDSWFGGMAEPNFFLRLGSAMGFEGFQTGPGNMTDDEYNADEWAKFMAFGSGTPAAPVPWTHQMTWDELKAAGTWIETTDAQGTTIAATTDAAASTPRSGTHYRKYRATKAYAAGFSVRTLTVGGQTVYVVRDANNKDVGIAPASSMNVGDLYEVGFNTSSRRCQFWDPKLAGYFTGATQAGRKGVGNATLTGDLQYHPLPYPVPATDSPATPGAGQFPYYFSSWKEVEHTHTRTFNNEYLMEMRGENRLLIHHDVATALDIVEGDWVWVETPVGILKVRAHPTYGIQAETVGFVRGFGHWGLGGLAKGRGAHDGWLLPGRAEIHSGQVVNKEIACRIRKEV